MTPVTCISVLAMATSPIVVTHHASGDLGYMKRAMPVFGFLAGRIDKRLAVSERARDSAARWLPGDYEIVPNGVLIPDVADPAGREHTVTFAGRQETRKGLQVLLRAWPEIHRRTGARLQVCGSDPLAVRLLLTRLRVPDDGIDILGFLPQEELTSLLTRTKALIAPSLGGESFGMVLTRAYACSLPVVASDIPGYREVTHARRRPFRSRPTTRSFSRRRSSRCSPTSRVASRWERPHVSARAAAIRLERHRALGSRGSTSARLQAPGCTRREATHRPRPESVGPRSLRPRLARRGDRRDLVARAGMDHRLPRLRLRLLALGDHRNPAQPALGPGPGASRGG